MAPVARHERPDRSRQRQAKRIKRVAFGLVNFRHHRVRCLLYAGKPAWTLLPRSIPETRRAENLANYWLRILLVGGRARKTRTVHATPSPTHVHRVGPAHDRPQDIVHAYGVAASPA